MQNRMQKSNFSFNFVLSTHKCKWQNSFQILVWKLQGDQYWCAVLCGSAQSCQRTFAKFTVQFSQCSYPCWKCLLELSTRRLFQQWAGHGRGLLNAEIVEFRKGSSTEPPLHHTTERIFVLPHTIFAAPKLNWREIKPQIQCWSPWSHICF